MGLLFAQFVAGNLSNSPENILKIRGHLRVLVKYYDCI